MWSGADLQGWGSRASGASSHRVVQQEELRPACTSDLTDRHPQCQSGARVRTWHRHSVCAGQVGLRSAAGRWPSNGRGRPAPKAFHASGIGTCAVGRRQGSSGGCHSDPSPADQGSSHRHKAGPIPDVPMCRRSCLPRNDALEFDAPGHGGCDRAAGRASRSARLSANGETHSLKREWVLHATAARLRKPRSAERARA